MQEPPTSTIQQPPARGPRFVRSGNGDGATPEPPRPPKPRLKKLRLALVILGLSVLALISTVFGMLMAVASDLPSLDSEAQFRAAENSVLYPSGPDCRKLDPETCPRIAKLTGNLNRILVEEGDISPNLKNAVIAIEDRRFYSHEGVDYTGIARALCDIDPELRPELKRRGLLTRDARKKERRKAGFKKARKRPQFSKR